MRAGGRLIPLFLTGILAATALIFWAEVLLTPALNQPFAGVDYRTYMSIAKPLVDWRRAL